MVLGGSRMIWEDLGGSNRVKEGLGVSCRVFEGPEDTRGSGRVQ